VGFKLILLRMKFWGLLFSGLVSATPNFWTVSRGCNAPQLGDTVMGQPVKAMDSSFGTFQATDEVGGAVAWFTPGNKYIFTFSSPNSTPRQYYAYWGKGTSATSDQAAQSPTCLPSQYSNIPSADPFTISLTPEAGTGEDLTVTIAVAEARSRQVHVATVTLIDGSVQRPPAIMPSLPAEPLPADLVLPPPAVLAPPAIQPPLAPVSDLDLPPAAAPEAPPKLEIPVAPVPVPGFAPVPSDPVGGDMPFVVGNDRDEYGCIGSAGYTWCEALQYCHRSWEEPCEAPTDLPTEAAPQLVGNDRDDNGCIGSAGYTWCEALQYCHRSWEEPCEAPTDLPTEAAPQLVGNDRDDNGCIGSAGYTWCEALQKCHRAWEEPCEAPTDAPIPTDAPTEAATVVPVSAEPRDTPTKPPNSSVECKVQKYRLISAKFQKFCVSGKKAALCTNKKLDFHQMVSKGQVSNAKGARALGKAFGLEKHASGTYIFKNKQGKCATLNKKKKVIAAICKKTNRAQQFYLVPVL